MNDRIDEIKTKWNFDVTLPMAVPWGKDDVVWLVGEVERLRGEAERANVTENSAEIKRLRGTLYTVMGACDAECAACGAYYVAKRALDDTRATLREARAAPDLYGVTGRWCQASERDAEAHHAQALRTALCFARAALVDPTIRLLPQIDAVLTAHAEHLKAGDDK